VTAPTWVARVMPTALIALMVAAGVVYLVTGDRWRAVYWLAGAMLNVAVTYGM
jgi:hypothetical protein